MILRTLRAGTARTTRAPSRFLIGPLVACLLIMSVTGCDRVAPYGATEITVRMGGRPTSA